MFVLGKFMRKQMRRKLGLYEFLRIKNTLLELFEHFLLTVLEQIQNNKSHMK